MEWKEYEEITKHIYETLGKDSGVSIECHGNSCKVTGKSGVNHQVDVLTKHSDGLHSYKTAIECKYWNDTINKDIVMKVAEIIEDSGINKGIVVSKKGFTPDAITFAKYKNIGLVELREMTDDDWEGRIKDISFEINMLLPKILGLDFVVDGQVESDIKPGKIEIDSLSIEQEGKPDEELRKYIDLFHNELFEQEENALYKKIYYLENNSHIVNKISKSKTKIRGLKFSGKLEIAREKAEIKGKDYIWLIMKALFEEKTFTISKDKEIKERKPK